MASLFSRLFGRFQGVKRTTRKGRRNRSRRLQLEPMEMRRLLAGDIATISGNVFTDLTDNGLDGSDVAIVGTNVHLYRDGGNGLADSSGGVAGGDDTFVGTQASSGTGDYSFANLLAGTYIVEQEAVAGQLQRTTETFKIVTITPTEAAGTLASNVDTFDDAVPQTLQANTGSPTVSDARDTTEAVGGERDILVNHAGGSNNLDVQVGSGLLSISTGAGTSGNAIITYDGDDNDATTLAHGNLSLDLTASSGQAFHFLAGSQGIVGMTIDLFSGAANSSTFNMAVPNTAGASATEDVIIRFSDFVTGTGTGADLTAVTAIRIQVDMDAATDAEFDFSQIVAPFVSAQNFPNLNPMSIGDRVFNDPNNNGLLDVGETGIAGVELELYADTNANGSYDDGVDVIVGTPVTTDATGNYLFDNLFPGDYLVLVPISQFATATDPLFGFVTSTGNDPTPDPDLTPIDGDDNGAFIAGVGVASAAITLASGSEPTNDGDSDTNTDLSLDFGFVPEVDVEVIKVGSVATLNAGEQLTYTITLRNNGNAAATNVLAVDDLPTGFTVVSTNATGGGTVTQVANPSGELEIAYATLTAGQSETITVVVEVPATAAAATGIRNSITASSDGIDTDGTNNSSFADVDITRSAVLTITKTDTPDPVLVGGTLTYEILVTNTGPSTASNVVISDTLPAGLTFSSVSTTAGTAAEASGVITVDVPTMAVSGTATVTVVTTVDAAFAGSTIANSATAQADEATLVTGNASTTVNPQIDLAITKSDDVDPVNRGGQIVYTMQVTNNGPSGATNVEVVDTLPTGVTFVSATGGTVTPPSGGGSDVTIAVGSLASGASTTVTVTVDVLQSAATTLTNNVLVRSTESTGGFDTNTANNSTSETTTTQSTIDLAITKSDSADPIVAGQALVYTIVVTNSGLSDATGVNVTDNLPDGIQITSATSTVGTVTTPASAQDTIAANDDDLTVAIGGLATGASATITVNATVLPATTGTLSNVASVATADAGMIESDTTNNSATETTVINSQVDLRVAKTDSTDPVIAGNALTYTITVTNDGPSTATNVNLTDTLPSGVAFTSVTASQGTASEASGVITAALGTLAPSASATVTVVVGVDGATRGTLTNTASATATQTETDTSNNSATATTTVNGNIDLAITKADGADPVAAGGTLAYTVVVTNNGPSTATNIVVTDVLPSSLSFVSGTSTVGSVTNAANTVTANVGTLASGASATITLNTTVSGSATGTISNTATVTATETETNSANNTATQTTDVAVPGSLSGNVYLDSNRNGIRDTGETGIAGVVIALSGTDLLSNSVSQQATTDANGDYTFSNLLPGTYQLVETQPTGVSDGSANVGTGASGTAGTNTITAIVMGSGATAVDFNFGELPDPLSKRRFLASTT